MQSYIRPLNEGTVDLRALMQSALPLLNKTSASKAVSTFRVWGSRSDRSCHQRDHTSHRAVGFLNLLTCCQASYLVELLTINHTCCSSGPCRLPLVPARDFSSRWRRRRHPDSVKPTRSVHSCSPPPRLSGSTRDASATPLSIGCDGPFVASPSAALPVHRESTACASSYRPACCSLTRGSVHPWNAVWAPTLTTPQTAGHSSTPRHRLRPRSAPSPCSGQSLGWSSDADSRDASWQEFRASLGKKRSGPLR